MFYLISPPEPTGWHLDHNEFARDLAAAWSGFRLLPPEPKSETRSLVWEVPDSNGGSNWLEGSLDRPGEAIYLRGDLHLAAKFADWLRKKVDPAQPLVFTDESLEHIIDMQPNEPVVETIVQGFLS